MNLISHCRYNTVKIIGRTLNAPWTVSWLLLQLNLSLCQYITQGATSFYEKDSFSVQLHLKLDTLELRRLRFDLIFYHKIFDNYTLFDPLILYC